MNCDISDERLNALVDGELAPTEATALLECLATDAELRARFDRLRLTKELVGQAYRGVEPPRRRLPQLAQPARPAWRVAVAAAVFGTGVLLGWTAHEGLRSADAAPLLAQLPAQRIESASVIVHVSTATPEAAATALSHVEGLIDAARDSGRPMAIEIVANGPGIDLLRASISAQAGRIEALRATHPELTLVACGQTLQKLQAAGADVRLLPGTVTATSALDQIVLRMQQGWAYVRI